MRLLLALAILLVSPGLAFAHAAPDVQIGPRDDLPAPSRDLARSRRALANLQETLPIFLTLAILSITLGEQGWVSLMGGALYFLARSAHAYCYMQGLTPWRSLSFLAGLLGTLLMALPLLPHLWS